MAQHYTSIGRMYRADRVREKANQADCHITDCDVSRGHDTPGHGDGRDGCHGNSADGNDCPASIDTE